MEKELRKKFRKFLESRSALFIYMKTYRERHLAINPDSWEKYLEQTTPELAIPGAFVYPKSLNSVYNRDYWLALHEAWLALIERDSAKAQELELLSDVDFFDVEKRTTLGLGKDTASLNRRYCDRLTFNQEHTKLIAQSGLKLVALGQSRTSGQVLLMVNNQRGITYNISERSQGVHSRNVVVASKDFCDKISRLLAVEEPYELLDCKLVNQSVSMMLFVLDRRKSF